MKEKGIVIIIISIFIMVVALSTTLYAWFSLVEKTQPIIIFSGKIELEATLYNEDDEQINSITISEVVPGDIYNYYLVVKNTGTILGDLEVLFGLSVGNNNLKNYFILVVEGVEVSFNNLSYLYETELAKTEEKTINFSIRISEDLEVAHLNGNDFAAVETIHIDLIQAY